MNSFTKPLIVKHLDGEKWELMEEFEYRGIKVPKSFITDFASIPKIFWSIIGHPTGKFGRAAVIHDYLYVVQITTRRKADKISREAMKELKVKKWRRWSMWIAVRIGGKKPWERHKEKL